MPEPVSLAQITRARAYLASARDLGDIKAVRDMAEAARLYARAKHLGLEVENEAADIKVRADRKLGEALAATEKQGPGQYQQRSPEGTVAVPPTLADLGITKKESSNAQALAAIPEREFEAMISERKEAGEHVATKPLVREGRKRQRRRVRDDMARGRGDPRPAGGRSGPVNQQRIRDARLQAAFSRALAAASEILVLSPERVLEVLSVADAERTDQKLAQLGIWLDRFREARAAVGPRVIGGGHG